MKKKIVIKPAYELDDIVYFIRREVERKNGFRAVTYRIIQTKISEIITRSYLERSSEGVIPKNIRIVTDTTYKVRLGEGNEYKAFDLYPSYEVAKRALDKIENSKMFIEEVNDKLSLKE